MKPPNFRHDMVGPVRVGVPAIYVVEGIGFCSGDIGGSAGLGNVERSEDIVVPGVSRPVTWQVSVLEGGKWGADVLGGCYGLRVDEGFGNVDKRWPI